MLMKIVGVGAGIIVAFVVISLVQALGHGVYPPPADLDPTNTEAFRQYVDELPVGALLFVLVSYLGGALAGPFVAGWIAGKPSFAYAGIVGGLVFVLTALNLLAISHPVWFVVLTVIGIPIAAFFGARLAPTRVAQAQPAAAEDP